MKQKIIIALLACIIISSCSSSEVNRDKLGGYDTPHIMTAKNGDKWLIRHNFGDNYTVTYLPEEFRLPCKEN